MTEQRDELQLVLLAQCDDGEAVEALFRRVQNNLFRYVRGLVGEQQAEDVLQDVFVKLWRNLKWLEQPELFRPWAYRIASRTCFEYLKRKRRWSEQHDEGVTVEELPSTGNDGIPELLAGMETLLDDVSPASRAVLLLHYGQDLAIDDVAAILKIGAGTAKSRLAYGLSCLRKTMKGKR
jgi:RNA polymerase sigma-70 factor (ECF subfamily)